MYVYYYMLALSIQIRNHDMHAWMLLEVILQCSAVAVPYTAASVVEGTAAWALIHIDVSLLLQHR